jgi:hypothetical protein
MGRVASGTRSKSQIERVYDGITGSVDKRLKSASQAEIQLDARLDGDVLHAEVTVPKLDMKIADARLYVALAEERVRWAGESGTRFHAMVVRSLAEVGPAALEPAVRESRKIRADWDLKSLSAELDRYLSTYEQTYQFRFSEKRSWIDPANVVVVAFVQNNATRSVAQTSIAKPQPGK